MFKRERIKARVKKMISRVSTQCVVLRPKLDKFKQPTNDVYIVASFDGYFQVTTSKQKYKITEAGVLPVAPLINLITVIDEDTKKIVKGDKLQANAETYKVIDKVDMDKLGIYYSIVLEEADGV